MKVLFCALHFGYFRNFESAVLELARRGHRVHLTADEPDVLGGQVIVERLAARTPAITFGYAPALDREPWFRLATKLRIGADFVRFHDAEFAGFRKTRLTLANKVPRAVRIALEGRIGGLAISRRLIRATMRGLEGLLPVSEASRRFLEEVNPDVVLLASVTAWRAPQLEHLRAARAQRRRTGICVFSWDHLSSKALMRIPADRVFVWNATQRDEAVKWHGVPEERIVVTGAQCYDRWFGRQPSRDRGAFCHAAGLSPERPFLLYVCSVMTPDPRESAFVLRWIEQVRRSGDPRLEAAGILVRPHPERMDEWNGVTLERYGNATLFGRNPIDPDAEDDYFDSLFHSHAVVGLVTSAFLEAAVVGRSVHAPLLPEFQMYQEGVQHFRYLLEVEGGVLQVSRTFDEHLRALAGSLARPVERDERNRRFVRAFVRPCGLDRDATTIFTAAVEELAAADPMPPLVPGAIHAAAQPLVRVLARSADSGWLHAAFRDTDEMRSDALEAAKAARKQMAVDRRTERFTEKQRKLDARRRQRRREQWAGAGRKYVAQFKGHLKALVGRS